MKTQNWRRDTKHKSCDFRYMHTHTYIHRYIYIDMYVAMIRRVRIKKVDNRKRQKRKKYVYVCSTKISVSWSAWQPGRWMIESTCPAWELSNTVMFLLKVKPWRPKKGTSVKIKSISQEWLMLHVLCRK